MRSSRLRTVKLLCGAYGLLLFSPMGRSQTPDAAMQASKISLTALAENHAKSSWEPVVVEIQINGQTVGEMAHVLHPEPAKFYATADSFADWRLSAPTEPACQIEGVKYFAIDSLSGATVKLDPVLQILSISVPPGLFRATRIGVGAQPSLKAESGLGMFLNHDVRLTEFARGPQVAALVEAGFFSRAGVLTTQFANANFTKTPQPIWLDTTFQREFPEKRAALTIGDAISGAAPWARQVHYTGLQWASKFATRPDFVPLVLPSFAGTAVQPSTVDIYINDMRTMHENLDPGPFTVQNIPVIGTQGDIRMVVTDALGQQHVVSRSFIASTIILPQGANEFTYEAGTLRRNFGIASWQHNSFLAVASHSRGMTRTLTMDARGEAFATSQTVAAGVDYALSWFGVISGGAGISHDQTAGIGTMAYGQFARQGHHFGLSGSAQTSSSTFRQLGLLPKELPPLIVAQAQISRALGNTGSLAFGYVNQQSRTQAHFSAASASLNWRMKKGIYIAAILNYTPGSGSPTSVTVNLMKTLGGHRTLSASADVTAQGPSSGADLIQQLPVGTGYGYRLHTDESTLSKRTEADLSYQNGSGTYQAQASEGAGQSALALEENASLIWLGPYLVRSRTINDSFALVEVPNLEGVKVFANNQLVGKTSGRGLAVITNLVPYQQNTVHLDDDGVPVDINLDLNERKVIPQSRMGLVLRFAAHREQGALLVLMTEERVPLPLGARVHLTGEDTSYEVVFGGEVFIPTLLFPAHVLASWAGDQCEVTVGRPPAEESLPRIGPLICARTQ